MIPQSPSQTVGPFFHFGLTERPGDVLVDDLTQGQRILLTGQVIDGDGIAIPDALIEIWQADVNGYYNHPADPNQDKADKHFKGFGRSDTTVDCCYHFKTVKPGRVLWDEKTLQAPHVNLRMFARGLLIHAHTRLYFSDESEANAADPILNRVPPERRTTLIARLQANEDLPTYRLDIHLQGEAETVFFDI